MRCKLICSGLVFGLLLLAGSGAAQNLDQVKLAALDEGISDLYGDAAFVSIATGSKKPIYQAPAVASVITAEQIKAMGARDLNDVLETVPGLHVVPSPLNRLDPTYSIRGIHTGMNPQVLMLMNGIPFPLLYTSGHPVLFRLPVAAISRIEVLRGPGSAVYGADAFAGVINIITKAADDIAGTEVGGRVGSFDTNDLWVESGQRWGGWETAFTLEWQQSDGDKDRRVDSDLQTALDSVFGTNASLAPGPLDTRYNVLDTHLELKRDDWSLRLWHWRQNSAGLGAGAAQALDNRGGQSEILYLGDLSYGNDHLLPNWELQADLHYLYRHAKSRLVLLPSGTTVPIGADGNIDFIAPVGIFTFADGLRGNPDGIDQQAGFDLNGVYTGLVNHRLRIGAGYKHQREEGQESKNFGPGVPLGIMTDVSGTAYVYMPDSSRNIWYLSLQDEWQLAPDWAFTGGVRFDAYSDFGSTVNPRLALVWSTRQNLTTKLLYGRAFRAPSFSEQFAINNPVVLGNPDLDPEIIDTLELAFDYRPTFDLQTAFSLFGYRADGLIEFTPDAGGTKTAQNARDQEGYGFEIELNWKLTEALRLGSNFAWQHSEDVKTKARIADAPGQQWMLDADWNFQPEWSIHPQITWVGDRHRAAGDNRPAIDDYWLTDLTLRRKNILDQFELVLAVRNLFNLDAREPSDGTIADDYPLAGRSVWAELSWRQ